MWVNACQMDYMEAVVDASPLRHGKLMPGIHTPIVSPEEFRRHHPDYVFVSAWNYVDAIRSNEPKHEGYWVVPLPEMRIYQGWSGAGVSDTATVIDPTSEPADSDAVRASWRGSERTAHLMPEPKLRLLAQHRAGRSTLDALRRPPANSTLNVISGQTANLLLPIPSSCTKVRLKARKP